MSEQATRAAELIGDIFEVYTQEEIDELAAIIDAEFADVWQRLDIRMEDLLQAEDDAKEAVQREMADVRKRLAIAEAENAFLKSFLRMHSPKADGSHSYMFQGRWPWQHVRGPTVEEALRNGMEAMERETGK